MNVNRIVTMSQQGQMLFVVNVPFLLSAQSFDFSPVCKNNFLIVSFIIGFSARDTFPACLNIFKSFSMFFNKFFYACKMCLPSKKFL